jgi:hypothetical protein
MGILSAIPLLAHDGLLSKVGGDMGEGGGGGMGKRGQMIVCRCETLISQWRDSVPSVRQQSACCLRVQ